MHEPRSSNEGHASRCLAIADWLRAEFSTIINASEAIFGPRSHPGIASPRWVRPQSLLSHWEKGVRRYGSNPASNVLAG
jgi:hypothetical protein